MKSSNRLLLWFGIAIGALAAVSIILVLANQHQPPKLPGNSPQATVQHYLQSINDGNYEEAFADLAPSPQQGLTYSNWVSQLNSIRSGSSSSWKAALGSITVSGNQATVNVLISVFAPGGPFSNPVRTNPVAFTLIRTGSNWLITSPTYVYWIY